jgi:hypothetical protein
MLVIIYQALGFSQGHLESTGILRRKGDLAGIGWVPLIEGGYGVRTGRLEVDLGSIGPKEVRGVKTPKVSGPDFTGVFGPWASPFNVKGRGTELGVGDCT